MKPNWHGILLLVYILIACGFFIAAIVWLIDEYKLYRFFL